MSKNFTLTKLTGALALISMASIAGAAGLDRTAQPSDAFSDSGTTAYISAYQIKPDTSGVDTSKNYTFTEVAQDYSGYGFGAKTDVNDWMSVGVFYDQPFGAEIEVKGNNPLVNGDKHTKATVESDTFTGLLGINMGDNFKLYGGPVLSKVDGTLELHSSSPVSPSNGYQLSFPKSTDYGYMVGAAFVKPEIGLKAAVTYRSEIEHDINFGESMPFINYVNSKTPLAALGLKANQTQESQIAFPQSVNIDFQTGLNKTTLLTATARWVPWSDFKINPPLFEKNVKALSANTPPNTVLKEAPLLAYSDDNYRLEVGIGKRLSPQLAVSGNVGWDSGAGNPVTVLGPTEGYYSVGLGAKYNVTPEWAVSLGGKYLMLGDADGQVSATKTPMGKFENNDAYILGMKLSYAAK